MRVLIFTQHFTPEITAARSRLHPIAASLAQRGHEVEVLTAVPNHPAGVVEDEFRRRFTVLREVDGFRVRHVWVRASPRKTMLNRLTLYGTYATMATLVGFSSRRPDVIFASSPPLPVAAAASLVARRHRVAWVMDVRDPWPEAAVILGELSNKRMIRAAERLERRLYASAAAIVTVTEAFRDDIAARTEDQSKISLVRNGTTMLWFEAGEFEVERASIGLPEDRFVWTYAGNVGKAQGLETAIDAAAQLGDGYQLLIIGGGPMLDRIKERAQAVAPGRVAFEGLMQPAGASRYLRGSDATLVPLAARPELAKFVPSKLFDYCAVGRPVILAADGESRRLATAAEAVYPVPPGDPAALAAAVRALRESPDLRERLSERGRAFAADYVRDVQVTKVEDVLREAAARHRAAPEGSTLAGSGG